MTIPSDPAQVVIPSKPRGKQACKVCGSTAIERQVRIRCLDCTHEEWSTPELVNHEDAAPELQTAIHDDPTPELQTAMQADDVPQDAVLNCNASNIKNDLLSSLSELQIANQASPSPPALQPSSVGPAPPAIPPADELIANLWKRLQPVGGGP